MQQLIYNKFCTAPNSTHNQLHLEQEIRDDDERFNDGDSPMLSSDSEDNRSSSDEFRINFSKDSSSQSFGLGYWIKATSSILPSQLPQSKSDKSVFMSKPADTSLSSSYQKPKRPTNNAFISQQKNEQLTSKDTKTVLCDIPKLKIPQKLKDKHLKLVPPLPPSNTERLTKRSKLKNPKRNLDLNSMGISCTTKKDSICLEKSFEKSNSSVNESKSQLRAASHDIMRLTLKIDKDIYSNFSFISKNIPVIESSRADINPIRSHDQSALIKAEKECSTKCPTENTSKSLFYPESIQDSLSFPCDIRCKEEKSTKECFIKEEQQQSVNIDRVNVCHKVTSRKRSFNSLSDDNIGSPGSPKRKLEETCPKTSSVPNEESVAKRSDITPIEFVKFLTSRLKTYESNIREKYCLSQPNAMKFLAQSHANNWESYKNSVDQMHLVPYGFLNEIFHRALHCFGVERKVLNETLAGNSSPIGGDITSQCQEYRKIRDEYSLALKRVRYGIGVIDELFRWKVNNQNVPQSSDVTLVRKWKHIIYYLCLHAKSAFLAKEIQYQNYVQSSSNLFDGVSDLCTNNTPSVRSLTNPFVETYCKPQLPKETSRLFDFKLRHDQKTLSPEHLSQSDLDTSPHSNDSGKGSSIRIHSNTNSLISGCHTTSSLNSTPHSNSQPDFQIHCPGLQLFRIDEYQATATDYVRLLPDAAQLHSRIVARIGTEPNANSRDNIIKLIYYTDVCQQMCKEDLMSECLHRLLTQVAHYPC